MYVLDIIYAYIYICIYIIYTYVYIYIEPLGILTSYKEYIYIYMCVYCLAPWVPGIARMVNKKELQRHKAAKSGCASGSQKHRI